MGLTNSSTGKKLKEKNLLKGKTKSAQKVVGIAGNPNVGKSTIFNALTGMNQHTGNWPGKTVANAYGYCKKAKNEFVLVDIPGTYSLYSASPEEEIARNFISFGGADAIIVVCDATCLERSLTLVYQILEITQKVVVCVNLIDQALKNGIKVNLQKLSETLGVTVVGTSATRKKGLDELVKAVENIDFQQNFISLRYPDFIEKAVKIIENSMPSTEENRRWKAIKLLEGNSRFIAEIKENSVFEKSYNSEVSAVLKKAEKLVEKEGLAPSKIRQVITSTLVYKAEETAKATVGYSKTESQKFTVGADKILTDKKYGFLIMLILLCAVFWVTISGANYLSQGLTFVCEKLGILLDFVMEFLNFPVWLKGILLDGVYKVTAWVVSVMLPPMAIFFPFFTLLEDLGYLPRVAYNLDKPFKKCGSCGKQALTMCMGFGCNAAGVVGCRIIDSKKERILAILTNSLVPCNGRFPAIIAVISMFFVTVSGFCGNILSSILLTLVILLGVSITFVATKILSSTCVKGEFSSYILEMPPYRKPRVTSVIIRSVFDRTLFVLGRSVCVAIPAGAVIWLLANLKYNQNSLLQYCAEFLNPVAELMGLDGVILMAFILGFPANETVIPIMLMAYLSKGSLTEFSSLSQMREVLLANGWDFVTAFNVIIFTLFHWPCSTTMLTVKKETGSIKWSLISFLLPTVIGFILCVAINLTAKLFN